MGEYALEMLGITKAFSKVKALDNVDLRVKKGEIHALIGENGAGKSTLMKILTGAYSLDEGKIRLNGEDVEIKNPIDAIGKGISIIYQELSLIPDMNAIQNVMLGHEIHKHHCISPKTEKEFAHKYLDYVCQDLIKDYSVPVRHLSIAQQQMVDIAKALSFNAKLIVMDEPTDSLTTGEIEILFRIVRKLKQDGITVIYISHRLEELFVLCDRVTVLRDGKFIAEKEIKDINKDWLISKMIGRDLTNSYPERHRMKNDETVLEAENISGDRFHDVSFSLHKGEILALSGLVGAGRTEVLRTIFGADKIKSGAVKVNGKNALINHPCKALKYGFGFATEDRKSQGLFLNKDIRFNIAISAPDKVSQKGIVNPETEKKLAQTYFDDLGVVAPDIYKVCKYLSGGNQQKVVLAKWLASECHILFLDEPTRGIDVGAKYEIYSLMDQLVQKGVSILMVSSEMPEVMGVADRVIVMHEGRVSGELNYNDFTEERIMKLSSGEKLDA